MNSITKNQTFTWTAALFGISLCAVCFIFLRISWAVFMGPLWEAVWIALFLFFFLHIPPIRFYITRLPRQVLRPYVIFFYVLCLGHCLAIPRTTFPFVSWNMYSDETRFSPVVKFFRYDGTTISGRKVCLRPEVYFRSLSNGRLVTDLDNLVSSIVLYDAVKQRDLFNKREVLMRDYMRKRGGIKRLLSAFRLNIDEERLSSLDEKKHHLDALLNALALRYDRWYPQDPLKRIDVMRGAVSISPATKPQEAYSLVWHVNV